MADEADAHVPVTRRQWDERMSAWFERYAHPRWAAAEPYWGMWCIPQSRLPVLPDDTAGATAVELGCGSAYVSAWLARRDARPVGVDVSARQLATARRLQTEFGLRFPLVHADAERVPLASACADLVISEYGASLWCDPHRWIPEAARLLRPGGRLVFMAESTLARMCLPEMGPATERLMRGLFGLHQVVRRDNSGTAYRQFTLPHGEWIRLMGRYGLVVEDLIEVQVPPAMTSRNTRTSGSGAGPPRKSGSPAAADPPPGPGCSPGGAVLFVAGYVWFAAGRTQPVLLPPGWITSRSCAAVAGSPVSGGRTPTAADGLCPRPVGKAASSNDSRDPVVPGPLAYQLAVSSELAAELEAVPVSGAV